MDLEPQSTIKELEVVRELVKGLDLLKELQTNEDAALRNDIPRHISKDSTDVVRDYLGKVAREWALYMRNQGRHVLENVPLDIVITHPVVGYFPPPVVEKVHILMHDVSPGLTRP